MFKNPFYQELFSRSIENVITAPELEKLLQSGRKLRIKFGVDGTSPDLHVGHAVSLWKIRSLQEAGHKAVILFGDFTTRIGDPTGKLNARRALKPAEIKRNFSSIERQISLILKTDPRVFELHRSSEWYGKMRAGDFLNLLSMVTHARLIERDMFQRRMRNAEEIYIHELIYPILQGYDSLMLKSDLTIIGSDQLFNEHFGRFFQEKFGLPPQVLVSIKILPGLDGGEKMSKSLGNAILLKDSPQDKFGKAMRVLDSLLLSYIEVYTDISQKEIREIATGLRRGKNPMGAKLDFAEALVRRYHGQKIAGGERKRFLSVFSRGGLPDSMPEKKLRIGEWNPVDLLIESGLVHSKAEARRLIMQKAVKIAEKRIINATDKIRVGPQTVIRVGKRRFMRISG